MKWRPEFAIGDAVLDQQHRAIFDLANTLSEAIVAQRADEVLQGTLDQLRRYAHRHFMEEEWLMQCTGYPGLASQVRHHDAFRARLAELTEGYRSGEIVLPLTLSLFVAKWLEEHLRGEDLRFARWLRARPPAEAPLSVGAHAAAPLPLAEG